MSTQGENRQYSKAAIVAAVLSALALSVLIVLGLVLPAEYSLDPLGLGKRAGVLGLAGTGENPVALQSRAHSVDERSFELAPFESVEFSYELSRGEVMVFSWLASDELVFNLHSSPDVPPIGSASDYAESFSAGRARSGQGSYTAPFSGQHGWFFENRTQTNVELRLSAAGFMHAGKHSALGVLQRVPIPSVFE